MTWGFTIKIPFWSINFHQQIKITCNSSRGNNEFKVTAYYLCRMIQNGLLVIAIYKNTQALWNQKSKSFLYHAEINIIKSCCPLIDWTFFFFFHNQTSELSPSDIGNKATHLLVFQRFHSLLGVFLFLLCGLASKLSPPFGVIPCLYKLDYTLYPFLWVYLDDNWNIRKRQLIFITQVPSIV